jgi:hypothetical protein
MKTLLPILLLVTITSYSQTFKFSKNEIDEFTGKLEREIDMTTLGNIQGVKFQALISQIDSNYYVAFYTPFDLDCASPRSSITYIKFEDGDVMKLNHQGDIECSTIIFWHRLDREEMAVLKTKKIAKIRYSLDRQAEVSVKHSEFFIKAFTYMESASK